MKGIGFWFFALAVLCVIGGMLWGIIMGIIGDHSMVSAHAHLNLVGWTTLALFGIYYTLTPRAAEAALARVHLATAVLGVATLVPGIALATSGGGEGLAIVGALVSLASMLIFLITVLRHGIGQPAAT